jgi:hypothetical protein
LIPLIAKVESCVLDFDDPDIGLPKYAPLILDKEGDWVLPQRQEDGHSVIVVEAGNELVFVCSGTSFESSSLTRNNITAK